MANTRGNNEDSGKFYFSGLLNHCRQWLHHEIKRCLLLGRKAMTNLCSIIKSFANITLPTKAHIVRAMVFPAIMYEHESWAIKRLSTKELMLLNCSPGGDSWESLGLQGDQPVNPKGNQPWIFVGRTDAEAETPVLQPPNVKNQLIGKDPDAGKDWRWEEKGTTEYDGWIASPAWWTWVWTSFGIWWWARTPGMLQSMGSQRVGHDRAPELNWTLLQTWTIKPRKSPRNSPPNCCLIPKTPS